MRSWFDSACSQRPLNHYHLLGLEFFESRPEVIEAAATRITLFLQDVADGPDRERAEQLLQDVAAAQLCLLGPAKKAAYDAELRATLDSGDGPQTTAGDQLDRPEAAPMIKVEISPAGSRSKMRQAGRRRDSEVFVPPPDFGAIGSTEQAAPAPVQPATEVVVPVVEVRDVPAASSRRRTGQRRTERGALPGKIDFDQPTLQPASQAENPAPPSAESDVDTIQVASGNRLGGKRLEGKRPAAKQLASKQPVSSRTSMASRRKTSALSWVITVGVCGVSAAAVVGLMVYLLGRPPVENRAPSLPLANGPWAAEDAAQDVDQPVPAASVTARTTPQRPRPSTNRSGVRGYDAKEANQRRQGIDSFAAMGRTEEQQLHRGEPIGLPAAAEQAPRPPAEQAPLAISEGLMAQWSFEDQNQERTNDDSPRENDAKLQGKPALIADGVFGGALRFDGRDDCLHVPERVLQGKAGTICCWFRIDAAGATRSLVNSADNAGRLRLLIQKGRLVGGYGPAADREPIQAEAALKAKTWHHVALTWKSGGDVVLYLDGRQAGRQGAAQLPDPIGLLIGKDPLSGKYFAFDADEIRLYDRPLSANEIAALAH